MGTTISAGNAYTFYKRFVRTVIPTDNTVSVHIKIMWTDISTDCALTIFEAMLAFISADRAQSVLERVLAFISADCALPVLKGMTAFISAFYTDWIPIRIFMRFAFHMGDGFCIAHLFSADCTENCLVCQADNSVCLGIPVVCILQRCFIRPRIDGFHGFVFADCYWIIVAGHGQYAVGFPAENSESVIVISVVNGIQFIDYVPIPYPAVLKLSICIAGQEQPAAAADGTCVAVGDIRHIIDTVQGCNIPHMATCTCGALHGSGYGDYGSIAEGAQIAQVLEGF